MATSDNVLQERDPKCIRGLYSRFFNITYSIMKNMLSDLLRDKHGLIIMKDDLGEECLYAKFFKKLLREQNIGDNNIKSFKHYDHLEDIQLWLKNECDINKKWNIIMPPFSDLLAVTEISQLIRCLDKFKKCPHIHRVLLWVTPENCNHNRVSYLVAAIEYLADMIIHLKALNQLTIIKRKLRGYTDGDSVTATSEAISIKNYVYKIDNNEFLIEISRRSNNNGDKDKCKLNEHDMVENTTFKIELNEDELIARNALRMPYERTRDNAQGNITYIPDANDDLDDEDPDDDLCI